MFDIGFSEILLVAVVALVVIGPERLPGVARNIGQFVGRLQRYVNDVKRDFNREVEFEEIRRLQQEMETTVQSMQASMKAVEESLQQDVKPREEVPSTSLEQTRENLDDLRTQVEKLEQGTAPQPMGSDGSAAPKPRKPRVSKKATTTTPAEPQVSAVPETVLATKPDEDQYRLF